MKRIATMVILVAALLGHGGVAIGQEFPEPPERYAAMEPWFEGEILELRENAGVIRLKTVRMVSDFEELIVGEPERAAWIELRYAKGWVYFDEEDGSQSRRNLREGRQRLRVGQIIAIGREPSQGGGWEGASIQLTGGGMLSGGKQVRLRGWILARVTPFRDTERAQEPTGSRGFDRSVALEDSAATSANVSVGDVNSDGHLDVLLVKGRHWPLENMVLLGMGDGSFRAAYPLGGPPDRSYSGELVDLDGDGDLDVVVSNDAPDPKVVHLNDGRGSFTLGATFGQGEWSTRHLAVTDLDGDGRPDAILANRYGSESGPSRICFGREGGEFADECMAFAIGSATTIKPADFDGDGDPDLAVPHRDGGQSFIYLNDGNGGFAERRPFGPATAAIRSAVPADLNGDGVMDLVIIDERTGPATILGRADGAYAGPARLGASDARPYALATADLDRNGRTDVIVGYVEARPIVYFNDGPETFHAVPFGDDEGVAYGFAIGDLDEDGFLDIAMARSDAPNMLYFGGPAHDAAR